MEKLLKESLRKLKKEKEILKKMKIDKNKENSKELKKRGRKKKEKINENISIESIPDIIPDIISEHEIQDIKEGGKINNKVTSVIDINNIKEKNEESDKKLEDRKSRQLRHSSFFLTINTNKKYNKLSQEYEDFVKRFKDCIDEMLNNQVKGFVTLKTDDYDYNKDIKNIESEYAIEIGPRSGAIHSHVMIHIAHYTSVKLNFEFITEFIKKQMDLSNIYLNSRVVFGANSRQNLKEYIEKSKFY
jgi:hypothetical protein